MSEVKEVATTETWEVREGVYSLARGEFSIWPVGSGGGGENRIACWIKSMNHARLMAASPDLLEACRDMLSVVDEAYEATGYFKVAKTSEQRMRLEAAIAKATTA